MRDVASMGGGEYLSALSLEETGEVGERSGRGGRL